MITIYSKEKISKVLHTINLTKEEFDEYIKDPFVDVPHLDKEKCVVIYDEPIIKYPTFDSTLNDIREMTREEVCQTGDLTLLEDGEKFQDGHIVQVPNPSTQYLKYSWNRNTFKWELSTTKEELQKAKTNLILEHNKKRKEIVSLNEEAEFFDVTSSVTKANDELEEIRAKITEIDKVIEEMNKNESSISNRA